MRETIYRVGLEERGYPLTIALIADLHNKPYAAVLRSLSAHKVDIIAVAGDMVHKMDEFDSTQGRSIPALRESRGALAFLKACTGVAPTYVTLGNHERHIKDDDIERIRETGCMLLDNEWTDTPFRSTAGESLPLFIGGLTSWYTTEFRMYRKARHIAERLFYHPGDFVGDGKPATDWLDGFEAKKGYKLLLCHHPEYWEPYLKDRHIDLVLSGHAHGGQIRIFGQGLYAPGQGILPKYTSGVHNGAYGKMVISRGLSNTNRFIPRLFNPPELVFLR